MPANEHARLTYPELSPELTGGWMRLIRVFGPGAIIASVTVGTGETIFAPRVGAIFGYTLLWATVMTVIFKAVQVYSGARYLVLTGEHPMQAWSRIPGPRAWAPALIAIMSIVSFPIWIAALADAVSNLCMWITGIGVGTTWGRPLWGTSMIVVAMLLSLVQTYGVVERVSTVILALKVSLIVIAVIVVKPDWFAAFWGSIVPHLPDYPTWVAAKYPEMSKRSVGLELAVLMGSVGGGVQDYVGYLGFLREKKWGLAGHDRGGPVRWSVDQHETARGLAWLRAPFLDTTFSFGAVLLMTLCFMILGAAVLNPQGLIPTDADLYSKQSQFLAVIHPQLVVIYKAGIFFAIFGVLYGAFELYSRSTYEPLLAIWPKREWKLGKIRVLVVLYSGLGGLLLLWSGWKTVTLASIISPFSGVMGCGLWCLGMIWVDRKQTPATFRMRPLLLVLTLIAGIVMTLVGGWVTFHG